MTTALSYIASLIASVIPGYIISPDNPAAILGFAVVSTCVLFAAHDYAKPRTITKRGLRG